MKLSQHQLSKIETKINISANHWIVRIDVTDFPGEDWICDNIYRIDENNEIIWQVYNLTKGTFEDDPFYYLTRDDQGNIMADRSSGFEYQINPENGAAKCIGFHK